MKYGVFPPLFSDHFHSDRTILNRHKFVVSWSVVQELNMKSYEQHINDFAWAPPSNILRLQKQLQNSIRVLSLIAYINSNITWP